MTNRIIHFLTDKDDKSFGPTFDSTNEANEYRQANVSPHVLTKIVSRELPDDGNMLAVGYEVGVNTVRK